MLEPMLTMLQYQVKQVLRAIELMEFSRDTDE